MPSDAMYVRRSRVQNITGLRLSFKDQVRAARRPRNTKARVEEAANDRGNLEPWTISTVAREKWYRGGDQVVVSVTCHHQLAREVGKPSVPPD